MSNNIEGNAQAVLSKVQKIFEEVPPGAVCELQDYKFRIGCGNMDQWDKIQEVVFLRHGLTDDTVRHHAQALAIKMKTGGSTAG